MAKADPHRYPIRLCHSRRSRCHAWLAILRRSSKHVDQRVGAFADLVATRFNGGVAANGRDLPETVQQLKPLSLDLAIVRRSLQQLAANQNQLAAKQDQITQNVATLQEVEQEA